jgi:hypothetical protein
MADSRTAYAGLAQDGDAYTAANHARMPGGWIGWAQVTADQSSINALTDLTGLSVTVTVNSDRLIRVTGQLILTTDAVDFEGAQAYIREGSTTLAQIGPGGVQAGSPGAVSASAILEATSGSHTYKLSAEPIDEVSVTMKASATRPAYILVEDLGPAPA